MMSVIDEADRPAWLRDQLLAIASKRTAELRSGNRRFTDDVRADRFIRENHFAALLGILSQQWRTRAGRAWEAPWRVHEKLGHLEPLRIASQAPEVRAQLRAQTVTNRTIEITVRAAACVADSYNGDTEAIWRGATAGEISVRIRAFHGAGPKIAHMAPSMLRLLFSLPIRLDGEIAVDKNVTRVFGRLGLVPVGSDIDAVQSAARQIYPETPGELDLGTWIVGAEICKSRSPACQQCPLQPGCRQIGHAES